MAENILRGTTYPCYQCRERTPGCHGKCEAYLKEDAIRHDNRLKSGGVAMAEYYRPKIAEMMHKKHMERRK